MLFLSQHQLVTMIVVQDAIIKLMFRFFLFYHELCTGFNSKSRRKPTWKNFIIMSKQNIDKKDIAKSLYLNGNFTQEEIADKVGTTRQTVSRWIKEGGWEDLKASITITPAQILSGLNRQIVEINNNINEREEGKRFATVAEADTLAKLASAIKKIEQDVGIADIVDVGIRFTNWLRPLDLDKAKEFNELLDAFIKDQMK
jgi:DNA-binding XRE family transcriptional regulator